MAKKMGRPQVQIDQSTFEHLCEILCTTEDIAHVFHCSTDTVERWCKRTYEETFEKVHKRFSVTARNSLRRMQYEVAMKGNVTMLIWLGKQCLGQRDTPLEDEGRLVIPAPVYMLAQKPKAS